MVNSPSIPYFWLAILTFFAVWAPQNIGKLVFFLKRYAQVKLDGFFKNFKVNIEKELKHHLAGASMALDVPLW